MKPSVEEITAFFMQVRSHDYYYDYSDDHRVWSAGCASRDAILAKTTEHELFKQMWKDYCSFMNDRDNNPTFELEKYL